MSSAHILAYLMNLKYKGIKLSQDQEEFANEQLQSYIQSTYNIPYSSNQKMHLFRRYYKCYFTCTIVVEEFKKKKKTEIDAEYLQLMDHLQGCLASSESLECIFLLSKTN